MQKSLSESVSELRANVRFLALMNASSRYWSSIHANECVFSRIEEQKVYSPTLNVTLRLHWAPLGSCLAKRESMKERINLDG